MTCPMNRCSQVGGTGCGVSSARRIHHKRTFPRFAVPLGFARRYGVIVDVSWVPFGTTRVERADAAHNREHLLNVAREMVAEVGVKRVTMDALAERAGLGKGTVFRRFGSRAGIFAALLDDADRAFQARVLAGPAPLGPGAGALDRLVAYGRARIEFLLKHHAIERAALDRNQPVVVAGGGMSPTHIMMLLVQARGEGLLQIVDLETLAIQLAAALEGPMVLYLAVEERAAEESTRQAVLADSWESLIERILTPRRPSEAR